MQLNSAIFNTAPEQSNLAKRWLITGITALALAGLFSILLVMARTPYVQEHIPYKDFFHTALVVHVDLSVVVWFMACAATLWTLYASTKAFIMAQAGWLCFALGTLILVICPFVEEGNPLMNNYIPVLQQPLFFVALVLLLCGISLQAAHALIAIKVQDENGIALPVHFAVWASAVVTLVAIGGFITSYFQIPATENGHYFYELLFWGGGHILQFTHTLTLAVVWYLLLNAINPAKSSWLLTAGGLGFFAACTAPIIFLVTDIESSEHRQYFTQHMIWIGSITPLVAGIFMLPSLLRLRINLLTHAPLYACLITSILLFAMGGIIGHMIQGINVTIPAHYHGSIVGITLAFMGLAYFLLPQLGFKPISGKLATWQPVIYATGQFMHISGLAWSGGYGVARKSTDTVIDSVRIAMGMMGLGGLLAVIGGILFVIVCYRSIRQKTIA